MKYGFVAFYTDKIARFAASAGFDSLELFVDTDTSLDLDKMSSPDIERLVGNLDSMGIKLATISCNPIHLDGNPEKRAENNAYFKKAIKSCRKFGTDIIVTNAFADKSKSPYENLKAYKEVFTEYAKIADSEGVKIAIENCPHWVGCPTPVGNIAFSPEMWDAMFDAVPAKTIGLEFDPSHLVWQGIDYIKAIRDYSDRIYAFHAKDTEILKDERNKYGIIGKQIGKESEWDAGWYRYRIPGFGEIDWKRIFNALYEAEYNGPMIIEHEDPVFGGDRSENGMDLGPRTEKGLKLGLEYLKELDLLK